MNEIIGYENNLQLFYNFNDVAKDYGLYSKQVTIANPGSRPDVYLVFSVNPIKDNVNPVEIVNRVNRNDNLFYPESFAVSLYDENSLLVWEKIMNYLSRAEFMCDLYSEFETPLPKTIRNDELEELAKFYCGQHNPNYDAATRQDYAEGIREFFKSERSKSKFSKDWQEFYRSELFDENKSFAGNFLAFLKRDEPETDIDILLESNHNLKKTYLSEHKYKEFREIIKTQYPDVKYNVSDKKVVDKGMIVDPKTNKCVKTQFGLTVTDQEYDRICEERFSSEGFDCLKDLNPSYFEGRDIVYKASDENIIASVINNLCFRWAKCPSLEDMQKRGKLSRIDIPVNQAMNFYLTMKEYDVPFYIDNDVNRKPNFDVIHVLYNTSDCKTVEGIVTGLTIANMSLAHVSMADARFDIDVGKVDMLIKEAKERSQTAELSHQRELDKNNANNTLEI